MKWEGILNFSFLFNENQFLGSNLDYYLIDSDMILMPITLKLNWRARKVSERLSGAHGNHTDLHPEL